MNKTFLKIIAISTCIACMPTLGRAENKSQNKTSHAITKHRDENLYKLAFDVYLANKNVDGAYKIAKKMVALVPDNIAWRRRLAKTAQWTNHYNESFEQYLFIANKTKTLEDLSKAAYMAKRVHANEKLQQLLIEIQKKEPDNQQIALALANVEEKLGNPEHAKELLLEQYRKQRDVPTLVKIGRIQMQLGQYDEALITYKKLVQSQQQRSFSYYQMGLIYEKQSKPRLAANAFNEAYKGSKDNVKLIQRIANNAWDNNNLSIAKKMYLELNKKQKKLELYELERLVYLSSDNPQQAIGFAKQVWQQKKTPQTYIALLNLSIQTQNWRYIETLNASISPEIKAEVRTIPAYWYALIKMSEESGHREQTNALYKKVITLFPGNKSFLIDYLWFILQKPTQAELTNVFIQYYPILKNDHEFWQVLAQGFLQIGQPQVALDMYRRGFDKMKNNPRFLSEYAVVLEDNDRNDVAFTIQRYAWRQLNEKQYLKNDENLRAFGELALRISPGDTANYAVYLNQLKKVPNYQELMLAYALRNNNFEMGRFLRSYMYDKKDASIPAWASLYMALNEYDTQTMQRLLEKRAARLPQRDRLTAARILGYHNNAIAYAYESLKQHPKDALLYQQFVNLMVDYSNYAYVGTEFKQFGSLMGSNTYFDSRYKLTPQLALLPKLSFWRIKTPDPQLFINAPKTIWQIDPLFHYWTQRGYINIGPTINKAADTYVGFLFADQTILSRRLSATFTVGMNQPTDDTEGLILAGARDYLQLLLNYQFSSYDILSMQGRFARIYDQHRNHLADGYYFYSEYDHKFSLNYPNYTIGPFVSFNDYKNRQQIPNSLQRFAPPEVVFDNSFFIPRNFNEYGIRFHFGQEYRASYSGPWRLFAMASVFYNTVTHSGYGFNFGYAGRVLGRDHLAFYYEQSTNQTTQNQINRKVGVSYSFYFD